MHHLCASRWQRQAARASSGAHAALWRSALLLSAIAIGTCGAAALPAASYAQNASLRSVGDSPRARSALAETYVKEQGHLHFSSKGGGAAIAEQGTASGTFSASLNINLTVKISQVSGTFVAYLKGGSISGTTTAVPHISGQWVSFKGTLTIKHGTGQYAGASGTASLYGSLNRVQFQLNVQVIGRLRL